MMLGSFLWGANAGDILIIDPSLRRCAGHPWHAACSIAKAATAAGRHAIVLGSRLGKNSSVRRGLRFRQCFTHTLYERVDWTRAGYEAEAAELSVEAARVLGRRGRSARGVILPTCDQAQLRAVALLIEEGILPKTIDLLAWLLYPPRWDAASDDGDDRQLHEYQDAVASIDAASKSLSATWLCCETTALRDCYGALEGAEIRLSAAPTLTDEIDAGPVKRHEGRPHFVVAGHAAAPKGYELLPDAIAAVLAGDTEATFTIHGVTEGTGNPAAAEILDSLSALGPAVNVLTHELTSEDYRALIRSADVILLPYRLPDYRDRGSGIFTDAERFGIPVVAPKGASFAEKAIREKRAIALAEHTSAALAEAIREAARNLATLRANCRAALQSAGDQAAGSVLDEFLKLLATRPASRKAA